MSKEFINNFIEFSNKIPHVDKGKIVYLTFSIIHKKGKPGKRNVLVAGYETPEALIEIFVQSPKEIALEGVDEKKLRQIKIGKEKFYTNYNPHLENFVGFRGDFYTVIKNEVLTVLSPNKNILKSVNTDKTEKFQNDLFAYTKKFLNGVEGFDICMVNWKRDDIRDVSRMIFFNVDNQTEIIVDIFKGAKRAMEILWHEIEDKKKISGTIYSGKYSDEDVLCSILDNKRVIIAKCSRGKKDFLRKIIHKIVNMFK
jgi:hypothetical protein